MSDLTFVLLSLEGPDQYSHAGGLGSRVSGLAEALACMGFETHLFFMGDPSLPGHEVRASGLLHLHRWCQWISRYHPGGVYDGEEGKLWDLERSLPPWLAANILQPKAAAGGTVVVLAEEWQTASTVTALHRGLAAQPWRRHVHLLWNANNTFSFARIAWPSLRQAAGIITVSRFMKHTMWDYGVDARVIPNGIPESWLEEVCSATSRGLARTFRDRMSVVKVARWDPDKRWDMAVDAVADMKRLGLRPLFLCRGGGEEGGRDVLSRMRRHGLNVAAVGWSGTDALALERAVAPVAAADVVLLTGYLSEPQRKVLFHTADAVLANSGIEPFGLVGLETMAVGGVALVGSTGEDYATPGTNAISVQTSEPAEIVHHLVRLRVSRGATQLLRRAARRSAAVYTWPSVIRRVLLPTLAELGVALAEASPDPPRPRPATRRVHTQEPARFPPPTDAARYPAAPLSVPA